MKPNSILPATISTPTISAGQQRIMSQPYNPTMTKTQAIKLIRAIPGMTARSTYSRSGDDKEIRVAVIFSGEVSAYYTTDPEDAVNTARHMAIHWNA